MNRVRGGEPSQVTPGNPAVAVPSIPGKATLTQSLLEPAPPPGHLGTGSHATAGTATVPREADRKTNELSPPRIEQPGVFDIASLFGRPMTAGGAPVQHTPASSRPAASSAGADPQIAPPKPGINKSGFIDNSDGANIRTGPGETGSQTVRDKPLPPATRVFMSGTHPSAPDWWYVTATLHDRTIVRGYVQGSRVNVDLPEPLAELRQLVGGETAEGLAKEKFGHAIIDGHDLRYYENVLLYVNQGRAGIHGRYQDPGVLGGGSNNIELVAGHRIWLVSAEYAKALQGVVPSGSLTGGTVAKAKCFAGHLEDILHSVTESSNHFEEVAGELAQAIHDHLPEIVGIIGGFLVAEATSMFLAAAPTGVSQAAAAVIQVALSAFGATGMVQGGIEALKHGTAWLTIAWTAHGKSELIAEASKEFLRMLVAIAAAALSYIGAKGNYGNALKIGRSMRTMAPALALPGGDVVSTRGAGTGVALGGPGFTGPVGTAEAMMTKHEPEGGASSSEESGNSKSHSAESEPAAGPKAREPRSPEAGTAGASTADHTPAPADAAYRETFFAAHPELRGQVVVHHAIEQQVLRRYPGLFSEAEIHALGNLRGIPKNANPDLHLSQIRKAWNKFYRTNAKPTKQQVMDFAQKLDLQLGATFKPPR